MNPGGVAGAEGYKGCILRLASKCIESRVSLGKQGCRESKSPHSRSTVKVASEKIRRQRDFLPAERKTSEPA